MFPRPQMLEATTLFIRASNHPDAFKAGEWAEIVGVSVANGRACWDLVFADGAVDTWVIYDPTAEYEFATLAEI